ncbi:MAG: acyl-CoA thioesterase [Deltaproteobacteria bacterium]|nr:acyl-CoA thioesterase [Deltaproteobacteria bacterium]
MTQQAFHFSTELQVRLPETDAMGIVFHGNYFTYLEVGRVAYLSNLGFVEGPKPIKDFDNVVVASHLDFRSPARLNDILVIDVCISAMSNSSFTFSFRLRQRVSNQLVAEGYTTHCAIGDDFRARTIPEHFRQAIEAFEGRSLTPSAG